MWERTSLVVFLLFVTAKETSNLVIKLSVCVCVCVCVYLNHFVVHEKLTQHCQ